MSLVGSLEDLGLGDLLQIVHLAGKSGVLRLRGDAGEGQIVFRKGMIREAHAKSGPTDLRELLAARRVVAGPLLERAWIEAHHVGRRLADVLVERGLVTAEAIDALRREQIESAVLAMFAWPSGEFSFEMRELTDDGAELALDPGVNPQFLALEGTRRVDENASGLEPDADLTDADDAPAALEAELVLDGAADDVTGLTPAFAAEPPRPRADAPAPSPEARPAASAARARAPVVVVAEAAPPPAPPVVLIDPSLAALEWAKVALSADFPRVHVFQRPGLGIDRIRQYLARAEIPLVVIAEDTPPDSAAGARDANEIVARLKRQAAGMHVLLLCDEGSPPPRRMRADAVVARPSATLLADPRAARERTRIAAALAETLMRQVRPEPVAAPAEPPPAPLPEPAPAAKPAPAPKPELAPPPEPAAPAEAELPAEPGPAEPSEPLVLPPPPRPDALAKLRETSARIREGAGRGEVLAQVLSFAAQHFSRVALFGVRGDRVVGVAQVGLARAGGPDDAGLRELSLGSREPAWFRRVIEERRPLRAAPSDNGDHRLAVLLGNEIPAEAYVAPIVTGERVAALLYADNLPGPERIGDTGALEVLLDAAGIALDRALIERTLARSGS
jgi:hypothetical protein